MLRKLETGGPALLLVVGAQRGCLKLLYGVKILKPAESRA
jgi:hypothetical protein